MVKYEWILPFLADAFCLSEIERYEFWAIAGYVYLPPPREPDLKRLRDDLSVISNPAAVRTPLWDFVFMTPAHRELWNVTDEVLDLLSQHPAGKNLLALKFDPKFARFNTRDLNEYWKIETIWAFRFSTQRYLLTKRYRDLMEIMMEIKPFEVAWRASELYTPEEIFEAKASRKPKYELKHIIAHYLAVTSHRWKDMLNPSELIVSVYSPYAESQRAFQKILESKRFRDIIEFDYPDFHELIDDLDSSDDDNAA